jgi:hypothetical protein
MAEVLTIEHIENSKEELADADLECPEKPASALKWLTEKRQLNDNQMFAHVTAEVQLALAATLRTERVSFPEGSNALGKHHGRRPAMKIDYGHVEVRTHLSSMTRQLMMLCRKVCVQGICLLHS